MKKKLIALLLLVATCISLIGMLSACSNPDDPEESSSEDKPGEGQKPDALVIMSEDLDGLFNPFYSTTGADATIVAMTQIGMLTTGLKDGDVVVAYGDNEAVVTKDFMQGEYDAVSDTTTYTFVLKNGLKFSDGKPLTMNDVLFNLYVYLDPVYTGSSTMYSTDIKGLQAYRTQKLSAEDNQDEIISEQALARAQARIMELVNLFNANVELEPGKEITETRMEVLIGEHNLSEGYKSALAVEADYDKVTTAQLLADYRLAIKLFREELERDYTSAKEAYLEEPYKSTGEFDEVTSFMYAEGYVTIEYAEGADGKKDKSKIEKVTRNYTASTKEEAINYVYNDKVGSSLPEILLYWATANEMMTEFSAKAKEVIISENISDTDGLAVKNISGIVSLGHTTDVTSVTIGSNTYTVAHEHNADGTPKNANEYDVLQITINGVDPKAVWNFAFSVAPQHYYAPNQTVDIVNNKFGVEYNSFDFMKNEIQSQRNVRIPMGAGAYQATDAQGKTGDALATNGFFVSNIVYFKANPNFMFPVATELIRYQVVSASNAMNALKEGSVHYVTPQFTKQNWEEIQSLKSSGIDSRNSDQLGYGYIGINASKITDLNLRKAIMCAMDTYQAQNYYSAGMAEKIYFPMSTVSWAYPKGENGNPLKLNEHDYPAVQYSREGAKAKILEYMGMADYTEKDLKVKFTIAGANLTDHPTYLVFRDAAELLNECGWDVEVVSDVQALTKLSSGSLQVWAAAWGSTVDPDLYQVYHKNSTATSTLAWGYNYLKTLDNSDEQKMILNDLSDLIDAARETTDRDERSALYEQALGKILDLAIELPVYQRQVLYAFNTNVIDVTSLPTQAEINPYTSPLDRIWEVKMVE